MARHPFSIATRCCRWRLKALCSRKASILYADERRINPSTGNIEVFLFKAGMVSWIYWNHSITWEIFGVPRLSLLDSSGHYQRRFIPLRRL